MKKLYYTIDTVLAVVGLIIAFENILYRYMIWILFYQYMGSLFVPFLVVFLLGGISGWCFAMGRAMRGKQNLDDYDV